MFAASCWISIRLSSPEGRAVRSLSSMSLCWDLHSDSQVYGPGSQGVYRKFLSLSLCQPSIISLSVVVLFFLPQVHGLIVVESENKYGLIFQKVTLSAELLQSFTWCFVLKQIKHLDTRAEQKSCHGSLVCIPLIHRLHVQM